MANETPKPAPLGSDLNQAANYVNMYRVRGDLQNVTLDFGYLPPLMADEPPLLDKEPIRVSSRLIMPYELAAQLIETLSKTLEAAKPAAAAAAAAAAEKSGLRSSVRPAR
ncbi:MAG: hypothetical protein ACAI44_15000 [Candidatus Sericytochromatia bacterium]